MKAYFLAALAATTVLAGAASARILDLANPDDGVLASRKFQCSLKDNVPKTYHWSGRAYSRVPGERDRLLFNLEGMNIRQCVTVTDPVRGVGYRLVSRELMLYLDPKTGEVLRKWTVPWTGETVDVIHVANDPVNQPPSFGRDKDGKPIPFRARIEDGRVFMTAEVPLFYRNPLAGDYQDYVGGTYQAMEIFDFFADEAKVKDTKYDTADAAVAWVRVAQWLPFMKMGDRAGMMIFNATGQMLNSWDELPEVMKAEIRTNYPAYVAPPPGDDTRPNETSWTYFKKMVGEPKSEAKSGGH